jgi:hypothetical protein
MTFAQGVGDLGYGRSLSFAFPHHLVYLPLSSTNGFGPCTHFAATQEGIHDDSAVI